MQQRLIPLLTPRPCRDAACPVFDGAPRLVNCCPIEPRQRRREGLPLAPDQSPVPGRRDSRRLALVSEEARSVRMAGVALGPAGAAGTFPRAGAGAGARLSCRYRCLLVLVYCLEQLLCRVFFNQKEKQ